MGINMGKIVVFTIFMIIVCFWKIDAKPQQTKPGCWYEGKRYQEGQIVNTTEPCLRCRCTEGSLRCRLRICPKLPSPAPFGCSTRTPRDNVCCPELVCDHIHEKNVTAKRDHAKDTRHHEDGCLYEGVRYGPGSAMMGSRRCEYCYCISGTRRCLRPRCLLPLAGCIPLYAPHSCCPVAYNCNNTAHRWFASLSSTSSFNGCRVDDRSYEEGEMVRNIGLKGTCDNCFCAMGGVRCVPLSCAPPLQGCTPIVREGQCCPSTYNCSGTIEVKATQNYASYAFISKDYAKFRKETNFFSMNDSDFYESVGNPTIEGRGHKNSEQSLQSTSTIMKILMETTTIGKPISIDPEISNSTGLSSTTIELKNLTTAMETTTKKMSTTSSQEKETMDNEIPTEKMNMAKFSMAEETTLSMDLMEMETTEIPTTLESTTNIDETSFQTTLTNDDSSEFPNSVSSREDISQTSLLPLEISTTRLDDETTLDYSTNDHYATRIYDEKKTSLFPEVQDKKQKGTTNVDKKTTTTRRIVESTTKYVKFNNSKMENPEFVNNSREKFGIGESLVISVKGPATGSPTTVLMPDNMFVINVTLKTNVSVGHVQGVTMNPVRSVPPDIEAILNITNRKKGEDYDYDYSQPTLPPSLPNVRIIPFVAADALVKQNEELSSQVTNYPLGSVGLSPQEHGPTVTSGAAENFYDIVTQKNRFSPPVETEGGFVPREPSYYDSPYRSTDRNLEIHTGVTIIPADITNSHRKSDELAGICVFENRNYHHGDLLPSSGHCIICICYYGEVACSDEKCPPLKIGCTRLKNDKICCGKIICVDPEESPTVVLDRADAIALSPREPLSSLDGIASPDPFRDVIKTKPAPDLPSLIEDMIPYLVEHRITKPLVSSTTPMTMTNLATSVPGHLDHRPEQQFILEPSDIRVLPVIKEPVEKLSVVNETASKEKVSQTSSSDSLKLPVNEDRRKNETQSIVGPMTRPSDSSEHPLIRDEEEPNESSIFSFGNVFDLLFSDNIDDHANTATKFPVNAKPEISKVGSEASAISSRPSSIAPTEMVSSVAFKDGYENSSKVVVQKKPLEVSQKYQPGLNDDGSFDSSNPAIHRKPSDPERNEHQDKPGKDQVLNDSLESSTFISTSSTTPGVPGKIDGIKIDKEEETRKKILEKDNAWMKTVSRGTTTGSSDNEIVTSVSGLLKLAGCNIYGRMYRVGRIITELSSPCLECRCTEIGVQCKQLQC